MNKGKGRRHWPTVRHPFLYSLIALALLLVVRPLLNLQGLEAILMTFFLSLVLVGGIYSVIGNRRLLAIALILGMPALAIQWGELLVENRTATLIGDTFTLGFVAFNTSTVLGYIMHRRQVTIEDIYGGLCGYLLLGVAWAFMFVLLEQLQPGSFALPGEAPHNHQDLITWLVYYSLVTLTTVGYGDIWPVTEAARSLSALEGVTGQVYLTVLIARLVGLHISKDHH